MDNLDREILRMLVKNADMSATEIGRQVNLSIPAVNKRIAKLKKDGIIKRFTVITDEKQLGKSVVAYVLIAWNGVSPEPLLEYINSDPDILKCVAISGEYDYLLKICAESIDGLEEKLLRVKNVKGVRKSNTMMSLREYKCEPSVI